MIAYGLLRQQVSAFFTACFLDLGFFYHLTTGLLYFIFVFCFFVAFCICCVPFFRVLHFHVFHYPPTHVS